MQDVTFGFTGEHKGRRSGFGFYGRRSSCVGHGDVVRRSPCSLFRAQARLFSALGSFNSSWCFSPAAGYLSSLLCILATHFSSRSAAGVSVSWPARKGKAGRQAGRRAGRCIVWSTVLTRCVKVHVCPVCVVCAYEREACASILEQHVGRLVGLEEKKRNERRRTIPRVRLCVCRLVMHVCHVFSLFYFDLGERGRTGAAGIDRPPFLREVFDSSKELAGPVMIVGVLL